jgi:hypothetical protein
LAVAAYYINCAEQFDVKNPFTNTTIGYSILFLAYCFIFQDLITLTEYKKKQRERNTQGDKSSCQESSGKKKRLPRYFRKGKKPNLSFPVLCL